eukprot:NODE_192_length_15450_cov_0.476355.p10 type:complete len:133 gc:universal NODE_192_length_15450_cov_0.476355:11790-12188(+)
MTLRNRGVIWMLTHRLLSNQNPFNTQESYFVSPTIVEKFQDMMSSSNHSESEEEQTEIVENWINESTQLECCQKRCLRGKYNEVTQFRINYLTWTDEQKKSCTKTVVYCSRRKNQSNPTTGREVLQYTFYPF